MLAGCVKGQIALAVNSEKKAIVDIEKPSNHGQHMLCVKVAHGHTLHLHIFEE